MISSSKENGEERHRDGVNVSGDSNCFNIRVGIERNNGDAGSKLISKSAIRVRHQIAFKQINTTNVGRKKKPFWQKQQQFKNQSSFDLLGQHDQVLEFVHITKTGGTAVETAAAQVGIIWEPFHRGFYNNIMRKSLPIPNFHGEKWHTPPTWFQKNPYYGKKTFTIVRNPYDRIVSEFYCEYFGYYKNEMQLWSRPHLIQYYKSIMRNPRRYHGLISPALLQKQVDIICNNNSPKSILAYIEMELGLPMNEKHRPTPTLDIFNDWIRQAVTTVRNHSGHMIPQHYYVYDESTSEIGTLYQCVDYVLRYENDPASDLSILLKQYGLPHVDIRRPEPQHRLDQAGIPRFSAADLDAHNICLINKRYARDFELFGYEMKEEK